MTSFIKLTPLGATETDDDKSAFLVNSDLIVSLQRVESAIKGKARTVVTTSGGQTYAVTDTPADIVAAIDLAAEAAAPATPAPDAPSAPVADAETPSAQGHGAIPASAGARSEGGSVMIVPDHTDVSRPRWYFVIAADGRHEGYIKCAGVPAVLRTLAAGRITLQPVHHDHPIERAS